MNLLYDNANYVTGTDNVNRFFVEKPASWKSGMMVNTYIDTIKYSWEKRELLINLAKKDFYIRYLGSYLGVIWAFINPIVTIILYWFIFQIGFKLQPVQNVPYVFWLIAGLVPWFFFSDCISNATSSILEGSYLVKKMVFPVAILPVVKIFSALFLHLFFIVIVFSIGLIFGFHLSIYNIQLIYYIFALGVLVTGISWITSSLVIFVRDIGQIIAILLQVVFFLTPIFWSWQIMPEAVREILRYNPLIYIIEGYRNCFFNYSWFWENGYFMLYYWTITIIIFITGVIVFKKLRPHFADML